jgi:mannose-6-phosphate isomerase-like protein (cupin superfamily)
MSDSTACKQAPQIRRVVTGHDADGKACVWLDGYLTNHKFSDEKTSSSLVWVSDSAPADFVGTEDMGLRILGTAPPACGTRFCVLEIDPGNVFHGVHRTDTLDYVLVLSGQMSMVLDDDRKVDLKAGDILIQRGTNHGWINTGDVPVRFAVVLVDGKPKRSGSVAGAGQAK